MILSIGVDKVLKQGFWKRETLHGIGERHKHGMYRASPVKRVQLFLPPIQQRQGIFTASGLVTQIVGDASERIEVPAVLTELARTKESGDEIVFGSRLHKTLAQ